MENYIVFIDLGLLQSYRLLFVEGLFVSDIINFFYSQSVPTRQVSSIPFIDEETVTKTISDVLLNCY